MFMINNKTDPNGSFDSFDLSYVFYWNDESFDNYQN